MAAWCIPSLAVRGLRNGLLVLSVRQALPNDSPQLRASATTVRHAMRTCRRHAPSSRARLLTPIALSMTCHPARAPPLTAKLMAGPYWVSIRQGVDSPPLTAQLPIKCAMRDDT